MLRLRLRGQTVYSKMCFSYSLISIIFSNLYHANRERSDTRDVSLIISPLPEIAS